MTSLPEDYLERVYAAVLGKLIGVYLGRPFEGWTHQRILKEIGPIHYYVHERFEAPLVVTDDDVAGTFTFVRALEEHDISNADQLTAELVGKTWLNNVINGRTIFWWGGNGLSTEHTAYVNLKRGIPAPRSGSVETNGKTIAEQIGAQIFIDGWALVAPGRPAVAAKLAEAAGSVSHDGESIFAAKLWAAMEAEAFVSKDVDHLIDTGLKFIPCDSLIATLIADIRGWVQEDGDWSLTRSRIEEKYGYDKFHGETHVVPNHGIMIMTLLYAGENFHRAMHIVNTCGWDTDCTSGNVGCLLAIMHGLDAFEGGTDWRGPLADRALISSADGGYSTNDAARIAYDVANMGRRLAHQRPLQPPKDGAQFHFTLPGSVQGFQVTRGNTTLTPNVVTLEQGNDGTDESSLTIHLSGLANPEGVFPAEVLTPTFAPPEVRNMIVYDLVGSPLMYPGQCIGAVIRAGKENTTSTIVRLLVKVYSPNDELKDFFIDEKSLEPGEKLTIAGEIPTGLHGWPIQSVGLALSSGGTYRCLDGTLWLDHLRWDGPPKLQLRPDEKGPKEFYKQSFVNGADMFDIWRDKFVVAQNQGQGIVSYGTRQWVDYTARFNGFLITKGGPAGVAVRVRGLNRYYALFFCNDHQIALVRVFDEQKIVLASVRFQWAVDTPYRITMTVVGNRLEAQLGQVKLSAYDDQYKGGGIGLVVNDGSLTVEAMEVIPAS